MNIELLEEQVHARFSLVDSVSDVMVISQLWSGVCLLLLAMVVEAEIVRQISPCTVETHEGVITLQSLIHLQSPPRFSYYNNATERNYTFHPCFSYDLPTDIFSSATVCRSVAVCAFTPLTGLYETLGIQSSVSFSYTNNETSMIFKGIGTRRKAEAKIYLRCDRAKNAPTDAKFTVTSDDHEGNVVGEISSLCCCPDGCVESPRVNKTDAVLTLAQIGVNSLVIVLALVVGFFCYNRRRFMTQKNYSTVHVSEEGEKGRCGLGLRAWLRRRHNRLSNDPPISSSFSVAGSQNIAPVLPSAVIAEKKLRILRRLGGGVYGDTYLAEYREKKVALKRLAVGIHQNQFTADIVRNLIDYTATLSQHRHKHIMATLGICVEARQPFIVNEYMDGRSLRSFLEQTEELSGTALIKFSRAIAEGMKFLHSRNPAILHRDLRCSNVLVNNQDSIKLVDFGVIWMIQPVRDLCPATDQCFCQRHRSACPASVRWTAPEVLSSSASRREPHLACDVYSFSMCAVEMLTRLDPFHEVQDEEQVLQMVVNGSRPDLPASSFAGFSRLLHSCWSHDLSARPTFSQICESLKGLQTEARSRVRRHRGLNSSISLAVPQPGGLSGLSPAASMNSVNFGSTTHFASTSQLNHHKT